MLWCDSHTCHLETLVILLRDDLIHDPLNLYDEEMGTFSPSS